uniref:Uncharacterized protein n=1 Tax=Arundo donax TaxID=35708 RepID=A0A0A9G9M9_ARUDO
MPPQLVSAHILCKQQVLHPASGLNLSLQCP